MPKYTPSPDEEELYGTVKPPGEEAAPTDAPETETDGGEETETTDEETAEMQNSAIVPNKVLMGPDGQMPKEGDEIVLRVVKTYGDESEVEYAPAKPGSSSEEPMSTDSEIEAMDEKGY